VRERLFDSQYGRVEYVKEDNVVLLTWREKCSYDDYRNVTLAGLSGLQKYQYSNFVVDARNGFEDEKEDVEWGFNILLPAMSKTTCKTIVFIMTEVTNIEEEMDMWTREFLKYFKVIKVDTYSDALVALSDSR
jgi:hypothetical protein